MKEESEWRERAAAGHRAAQFESPGGQPRPTAGADLQIDTAAASPPADLHVLASQIQRILDEEARRHGIDL